MTDHKQLGRAQQAWIELGGQILPLYADKSPAVPSFRQALTSCDTAVGPCWGALIPDGIVVIDVDTKDGRAGRLSYERMVREHGLPDDTAIVRTPTRGLHVYLTIPDGMRTASAAQGYPGIDLRGPSAGGGPFSQYVVGAGSHAVYDTAKGEHVEGDYELIRGSFGDIKPCPESLLEVLTATPRDPADIDMSACEDTHIGRALYVQDIDRHVREHGLHQRFIMAQKGLDRGLPLDVIEDMMLARGFMPDGLTFRIENASRYRQSRVGTTLPDFQPIEPNRPPKPAPSDYFIDSADMTLERPRWLIEGVMQPESSAMLVGESGTYKSFIAIDWALSIAYQRPWFGHEAVEQGPVIYIAGEGQAGLSKRVHAWHKHHGVEREAGRFLMPRHRPQFPSGTEDLMEACEAFEVEPAMVVLDTVNRTIEAEENSADDWRRFMADCADVLHNRWPDVVVLVVHHLGKDRAKGDRGTSARYASMDHVYEVTKGAGGGLIRSSKMKESDDIEPIEFSTVSVVLELDNVSLALEPGVAGVEIDTELDALHRVVKRMVQTSCTLTEALREEGCQTAGKGRQKIVTRGLDEGLLVTIKRGHAPSDNAVTMYSDIPKENNVLL